MSGGASTEGTKTCSKCGEAKPLGEFHRRKSAKDGRHPHCKLCVSAYGKANNGRRVEKNREWRETNADHFRGQQREYKRENAARYAAHARRYYAADPEKHRARAREAYPRKAASTRASWLKRKYGLSPDQYEDMLRSQDGGCAICGTPDPGFGNVNFDVDHDHSCCSGERACGACNRGLLCRNCNWLLGNADDSPERLEAAAAYLRAARNNTTSGAAAPDSERGAA